MVTAPTFMSACGAVQADAGSMGKMTMHQTMTAAVLATALAISAPFAKAAEPAPPRDPATVVRDLGDRIYSIGETTGNTDEMIAAEADAAAEIRRYLAMGKTDGLLAPERGKSSPLGNAAYMGYPNVVAALLTSKAVVAHLNDIDDKGVTPWIAAVLSMKQSAVACNPAIAENPFGFIPLLVTQPYYTANPVQPYEKTRQLLERAGAVADVGKAKEVWMNVCKNQSAAVRDRVRISSDLQKTVQEVGMVEFAEQLRNLQKKMEAGRAN
jgi:hypothetical protein